MSDTMKEAVDNLREALAALASHVADADSSSSVLESVLEQVVEERDAALAKVAELSGKIGELTEVRQAAAVLLRLGVGDFVYHVRDTENVRDTTPKGASTWDHPDVKAWSAACETMRKITKHTAGEGQQKEST